MIEYTLRIDRRVKGIRLNVHQDGSIVVSARRRTGRAFVESFVQENKAWIEKMRARLAAAPLPLAQSTHSPQEIAEYKKKAQALAAARLAHFNQFYGFTYGRITIKNLRSRWGSCSSRGNLNFNYRIALLPPKLADYIIVHELCHLQELNHSARFRKLMERTIPDWKPRRSSLARM